MVPEIVNTIDKDVELLVHVDVIMTDKRKFNKQIPSATEPEYVDSVVISWRYLEGATPQNNRVTLSGDAEEQLILMDACVKAINSNCNVKFLEYLHSNKVV